MTRQWLDYCHGWANRAVFLFSALQVGLATGARELAVAYAQERQQFGKPIGQFQAVKHMCADMYSREEVAQGRAVLRRLRARRHCTAPACLPLRHSETYQYFPGCDPG